MPLYQLMGSSLELILKEAETNLFLAPRIKFERLSNWNKKFPANSGIYALFDGVGTGSEGLMYIGESGKLNERMKEIHRTVNHSFRVQLGKYKYNGIRERRKKYLDSVEMALDDFFNNNLYVAFLEVSFGRIEIETYLVDKYRQEGKIYNSEKKRK